MFTKPQQILEEWLDGLNCQAGDEVLALYSENAVLLPTFSDKILHGLNDIGEYFQQLSNYNCLNVALHEETCSVQDLSSQIYCLSGVYTWSFDVEAEKKSVVARFTFIVDLNLSSPILHHHSSQLPPAR